MAAEPAYFQLSLTDDFGGNEIIHYQGLNEWHNISLTDAVQNAFLPHDPTVWAPERHRMYLSAKPLAQDGLGSDESTIRIPYTLKKLDTGDEYERYIVSNDLVGWKKSGSVDIICNTTSFTRLGYFRVPDGYAASWGHKNALTSTATVMFGDDS